jgi:hypothetical protein
MYIYIYKLICLILPAALGPGVYLASDRNEIFWWVKCWRCVKLTTSRHLWADCLENWGSLYRLYRPNDRRLSAKLVPTFADRSCNVVSVKDSHGRILGFLDRSRYYFFQLSPQLYSRGWVDPVFTVLSGTQKCFILCAVSFNWIVFWAKWIQLTALMPTSPKRSLLLRIPCCNFECISLLSQSPPTSSSFVWCL